MRRTARLGDAWYPIGTNPANPLDSVKRFATQVARLRALVAKEGRPAGAVGLALRVTVFGEGAPAQADDDFTVATIVAPSAMKQTEEEETAAEGEVPTIGDEEAEGEGEGGAEGGEEA